MKKKIKKLMGKALGGDSAAYRKLGLCFLEGKGCKKDRRLAKLFLGKSMELGDREGYFAYHQAFSKGKQVIDDTSYEMMCREYGKAEDGRERGELERYLALGTERQRKLMPRSLLRGI